MAKLHLSLDGKFLGEFPLTKERLSIGRRASSDIHIDNLAVSGEHAVVVTLGADSFLEDLDSTNGTTVNQKLVKKHVLQDKDVIAFGKYQLQYLIDNAAKPAPAMIAQTPSTGAVGVARLQSLNGEHAGEEILLNRAMVKLNQVSGQLAVINRRDNGYFISHIEGARPIVNQRPLGAVALALHHQDLIELGGVKMKFLLA